MPRLNKKAAAAKAKKRDPIGFCATSSQTIENVSEDWQTWKEYTQILRATVEENRDSGELQVFDRSVNGLLDDGTYVTRNVDYTKITLQLLNGEK